MPTGHAAVPRPPRRRPRSAARPGLPGALALALGLALGVLPAPARARAEPRAAAATQAVTAAELEARHGLRVDRVTVTGSGGLVDLRFTILDPAKARPLLEGGGQELRLVAEPGGETLHAPHHGAMRNVRLARDSACFVLFPNARGAVRPGTRVAVSFGALRGPAMTAR